MSEIINFPTPVEKPNMTEVAESLSLSLQEEGMDGFVNSFANLFDMADGDFMLISPSILSSFQRSVNNPADRIALVQALNAAGMDAETFSANFADMIEELDKVEGLSDPKKEFFAQLIGTMVNAINETEGIAKRIIQVPVEICRKGAKLPQYANASDSGMDLFALEDYTIAPGETKLIPTGIKLALPPGYEIQVRPKSGRSLKTKLRVANTPGTVDAGYRDEICVILENIEPPFKDINYHCDDNGHIIIDSILHGASYSIGKGEKFAQLVLSEVPKIALYEVEKVSEIGENRGGGFGSTGLK